MTTEQINSINIVFKNLSDEIKDWVTSKETSDLIVEIAQQYILSKDQKMGISFLLMRLVTQNLPPEQFKSALAEALAIAPDVAEKITDALALKILMPIKQSLQSAGVNIDLLTFNTPVAEQGSPPETQHPESRVQSSESSVPSKPFVLHEEPSFSPQATIDKPSFIFNPAESMNTPHAQAPVKVIIERVVHYSTLYTPLNKTSIPKKVVPPKTKWFI